MVLPTFILKIEHHFGADKYMKIKYKFFALFNNILDKTEAALHRVYNRKKDLVSIVWDGFRHFAQLSFFFGFCGLSWKYFHLSLLYFHLSYFFYKLK